MKAAIRYALKQAGNDSDAYKSWGQEDQFFVRTLVAMEKAGAVPVGSLRLAGPEDTKAYGAIGKTAQETALIASGTPFPDWMTRAGRPSSSSALR